MSVYKTKHFVQQYLNKTMPRRYPCKCVIKIPAEDTSFVDDNAKAATAVVEASLVKGSVDSSAAYSSSEEDVGTKRQSVGAAPVSVKRLAVPSSAAAEGPVLPAAVDPRPAAVVAKSAAEGRGGTGKHRGTHIILYRYMAAMLHDLHAWMHACMHACIALCELCVIERAVARQAHEMM